jgi:hypothetical protein
MRILRCPRIWLRLLGLACLLLNIAGCGGDAYEKQFDESLQHLKTTGQPLGRPQAGPPADVAPADGTAGQQQSAQQQPQQN